MLTGLSLGGPFRLGFEWLRIQTLRWSARARAEQIVGAVGRDSQQPRPDDTAAEAIDRVLRPDERVLCGVFSQMRVTEHAQAGAVHCALMPNHQLVERIQIA